MANFFDNFGQLLSEMWERIRPRFKNIAYLLLLETGIGIVAFILVSILIFVIFNFGFITSAAGEPYNLGMPTSMFLTHEMRAVVLSVIWSVVSATPIVLIAIMLCSFIYLACLITIKEKPETSFKEILELSKKKYWSYFGTLFLSGLLIALASLALLVPGIILAILYFAVPFIVIETNLTNSAALKASCALVKERKGMIFLNLLVWMIFVSIASIILAWLVHLGLLILIAIPVFTGAFNYELYLSLKAISKPEEPEASMQPETPQIPSESQTL